MVLSIVAAGSCRTSGHLQNGPVHCCSWVLSDEWTSTEWSCPLLQLGPVGRVDIYRMVLSIVAAGSCRTSGHLQNGPVHCCSWVLSDEWTSTEWSCPLLQLGPVGRVDIYRMVLSIVVVGSYRTSVRLQNGPVSCCSWVLPDEFMSVE